jgi:hypothetical protein
VPEAASDVACQQQKCQKKETRKQHSNYLKQGLCSKGLRGVAHNYARRLGAVLNTSIGNCASRRIERKQIRRHVVNDSFSGNS